MNVSEKDLSLRRCLVELLDGGAAHLRFEDVVRDWPETWREVKPPSAAHTPWQVLEHIRIALADILDFSRNPHYRALNWPQDYWPPDEAPPSRDAWDRAVAQVKLDLAALKAWVEDPESDLFAPFPWGEGQALLREAMLAADHNAYHLGELVAIRKMLSDREDQR